MGLEVTHEADKASSNNIRDTPTARSTVEISLYL